MDTSVHKSVGNECVHTIKQSEACPPFAHDYIIKRTGTVAAHDVFPITLSGINEKIIEKWYNYRNPAD